MSSSAVLPTVVAGLDVHKSVLMVVLGSRGESEPGGPRAVFGTTRWSLRQLAAWLHQHQVDTVVMESTAQYWWPVWRELEDQFSLHLAQARSNPAPHGRKTDYGDAARLVRRFLANDLRLSFVPEAQQRDWRRLSRSWKALGEKIVEARNEIEAILEEGQIKLSGVVSDLLGVGARRMLQALIEGVTDPAQVAQAAGTRLQATSEQLQDALDGHLSAAHRLVLRQHLDYIDLLERQQQELSQALQQELAEYQETLERLCQVPGIALIAAQRLVAEIGPRAAAFPSPGHLASWAGLCPGRQESGGQSVSQRCPSGNRQVRAVLSQIAHAAIRTKGSRWAELYHRWRPRLGKPKAIWAVAHKLLCVIWVLLAKRCSYQERGERKQNQRQLQQRMRRIEHEFRRHGMNVTFSPLPSASAER